MVSVGDSNLGSTEVHFIEPGVKVNGTYYRINLLAQKLYYKTYYGYPRVGFVFQQDGASSTRNRLFPGAKGAKLHSTPHALWPPNSTDLSSVYTTDL